MFIIGIECFPDLYQEKLTENYMFDRRISSTMSIASTYSAPKQPHTTQASCAEGAKESLSVDLGLDAGLGREEWPGTQPAVSDDCHLSNLN
jgi:hypothetical protein